MNVGEDAVWMDPGLGRVVDLLRRAYPLITLCLSDHGPLRSKSNSHRTTFRPNEVIRLPEIISLPHAVRYWGRCASAVNELQRRSDVVVAQIPFEAPLSLAQIRRPVLYHAIGDIRGSANSYGNDRITRSIARLAGFSLEKYYTWLVHRFNNRMISNGRQIYERYGSPLGRPVVSATLSEDDLRITRTHRALDSGFQILYVGFLRPGKGIEFLIDAFRQVKDALPKSQLVLVGTTETVGDTYSQRLALLIAERGLTDSVKFCGHVSFGSNLFQLYADADVLVLPSLAEGTPRVLVEARAFGCPVVATRVGGVESSVEHGKDGLLVAPRDAAAIATAVLRIATDDALRNSLVNVGKEKARKFTVEAFVEKVVGEIDLLPVSRKWPDRG